MCWKLNGIYMDLFMGLQVLLPAYMICCKFLNWMTGDNYQEDSFTCCTKAVLVQLAVQLD